MANSVGRLVLLRHGQSQWNQENRFTGWMDVDLTAQGVEEARRAGRFLREAGFLFSIAYTSLLKRSIRSLWIVLDELDQMWLPENKTWRLNERHYGALQGLDKAEMATKYGKEQVFQWRRSFAVRPPLLAEDEPRHPRRDPRYAEISPEQLPGGESLEDTLLRVMPCWQKEILPRVLRGEWVLVVAHGNSLRALVKYLDGIPDAQVPALNIPLGIPIDYRLNEKGEVLSRHFVGDAEAVRQAAQAAAQAAQVKLKGS